MMGALTVPSLLTMKCKIRGTLSYPTYKVFVKVSKKICGRYGIQTHFKGGRTIKNLLVSPKDKDPMVNPSGAIYWYHFGDLGCNDEYIGKPPGPLVKDTKSTWSPPLPFITHSNQTGHTTNQNYFQIIGREMHNLARNIKESIYIRVNNPTLNNNIGKFNVSHIWDRVLLNTKGLTLNNQNNNNNNQLTNPHYYFLCYNLIYHFLTVPLVL